MAIFPYQINQALLSEFSIVIFRLGDAVAVREKDVTIGNLDNSLVVDHFPEKPDYRSSAIESANCPTLAQNDWREMAGI